MEGTNNKIDLEKMARLLNGFNVEEVNTSNNRDFLDLKKCFLSGDDSIASAEEFFEILNIKGNIIGYSGISKLDDISEDIASNINLHTIKDFEYGVIVLILSSKVSLFHIDAVMKGITQRLGKFNDFIFETYKDEELEADEIKHFTILAGVENKATQEPIDNLQENYVKLLFENKLLKIQNEKMQQSLICLARK